VWRKLPIIDYSGRNSTQNVTDVTGGSIRWFQNLNYGRCNLCLTKTPSNHYKAVAKGHCMWRVHTNSADSNWTWLNTAKIIMQLNVPKYRPTLSLINTVSKCTQQSGHPASETVQFTDSHQSLSLSGCLRLCGALTAETARANDDELNDFRIRDSETVSTGQSESDSMCLCALWVSVGPDVGRRTDPAISQDGRAWRPQRLTAIRADWRIARGWSVQAACLLLQLKLRAWLLRRMMADGQAPVPRQHGRY